MANTPVGANAFTVPTPQARVHVLAEEPSNPDQRLAKALSDDVFSRLVVAFRHQWPQRSIRIVDIQRLGEMAPEGVVLTSQWNSSFKMSSAFMSTQPPYFNYEHFRWNTDQWIRGTAISPAHALHASSAAALAASTPPVEEMFGGGVRVVGIPILPFGVQWRSLHVDEDTGIVMRSLAVLNFQMDEFILRWDVICG